MLEGKESGLCRPPSSNCSQKKREKLQEELRKIYEEDFEDVDEERSREMMFVRATSFKGR